MMTISENLMIFANGFQFSLFNCFINAVITVRRKLTFCKIILPKLRRLVSICSIFMLHVPAKTALFFRHLLFAESIVNSYAGSGFPGLADALEEIKQGQDVDHNWEILKQHYAVLLFTIQSAASTLKDVTDFMYNYY